ncbi:hypothetical protein [Virgibacillus proomii]|uniref:hypothetical protein n=1 Tax=Virgibacillus proomii TaxID=84407 RepID=UPI001C127ABC|nr:hypothetical protein [Virgibacillus proomii]MBU5266036.1 hypothetical protein [Virgibacillus proomii]
MEDTGTDMFDSFGRQDKKQPRQRYIARRKSVLLFQGQETTTTAIHRDFSRTRKATSATHRGFSRTLEIFAFILLLSIGIKENQHGMQFHLIEKV